MTMMMKEKWNVELGDVVLSISPELAAQLGYAAPDRNDGTRTATYGTAWSTSRVCEVLIEAVRRGLRDDHAALEAISLQSKRRDANNLETARQKVAEIELATAKERLAAERLALTRQREALEAKL